MSYESIVDADDQKSAVRAHLASLGDTEACKEIAARLAEQLTEVRVDGDKLVLCLQYKEYDDEIAEIELDPPAKIEGEGSYARLARVHNGVGFEALGGGWYAFNGIDEEGAPKAGGWEFEALEEADEDNADFLARLAAAGKGPEDVPGVFDYGQNWIVWSPAETNDLDEPALYFVSHGDCVAQKVEEAEALSAGAVLLRILAEGILDEDHFEATYS